MRVLLVLLLGVLISGCTASSVPAATIVPTSAAPATTTEDTGGIEGMVMDDEARPVAGVEVGLIGPNLATKSDTDGRFSFSELAPGSHDLIAQRLGYETTSRRLDVQAGAVTNVTLTLRPLVIVEPYAEGPFIFNGYNQFGSGFVDIVNQDGLVGCQKCLLRFNVTESVEEVILEVLYKPTISHPQQAATLTHQIRDQASGTLYAIGDWAPRDRVSLNHENKGTGDAPLARGAGQIRMINYCDSTFVCVDQKFDVYYTLFHRARAPEGFSALPPP